jgi:myo-inositol-1(or 4)-monophosphatase
LTLDDLNQRENALEAIIREAGTIALEHFNRRTPGQFTLKGRQDYLTEADTLVEQHIKTAILSRFPEDGLLGEEHGGSVDTATLWVVDPIDGTANFARGIPHFCTSIAFVHKGVTELGAIYNPVTDELYFARRNQFVTKNGHPLSVAQTRDVNTAIFELGWSPRIGTQPYVDAFAGILESGASVRRGSSGALAIAWVAEGRCDGYAELNMNAWDCLAGLLMVREAGGRTGLFPATHQDIACSSPVIAVTPGVADALSDVTKIPLAPELK